MATVVHVGPWGIKCGVAKHLSYWLAARSDGCEHRICTDVPPAWYGKTSDWEEIGVPVTRVWERGREDALPKIEDFLDSDGAAIVHLQYDAHLWPWVMLAPFFNWCRGEGIKTIATAHVLFDLTEDATRANCAMLEGIDRLVVGTPHMVRAFADYAAKFHITLRGPVEMIPLAAPPLPPGRAEKAAPYPCVFTFGLLGGHKGHADMLEGVRQLRSSGYPDARYVVAGAAITGEQRQTLEVLQDQARRWPGMVEVREGFHDEAVLYRWCQEADVVALGHKLPYSSSSGTAILAVASGSPVAVSDMPMLTSGLEDAVARVGMGPEDWAHTLAAVLNGHGPTPEARASVAERFLPTAVAAQYEALYASLLDEAHDRHVKPTTPTSVDINAMLAEAREASQEANEFFDRGQQAQARARHLIDQAETAMKAHRADVLGEGK